MTSTPFMKLQSSGLPYDWTTVLIGWRGIGTYFRLVSTEEVILYADNQLNTTPDDKFGVVLELSQATPDNTYLVNDALNELASHDSEDWNYAEKTWQLVLLKDVLSKLSNDPINSLTELSGFWSEFDYPLDSPHIVQGRNNTIFPQDYYTEQNLNQILDKHLKWVRDEEELLKSRR